MPKLRHIVCLLIVVIATGAAAQTEYEAARNAAIQQLGSQLQAGEQEAARRDLAGYVERFPGDAVMQYNLACLDAVAGHADSALAYLDRAFAAGYPDLARPLHDPDLISLVDDPRLNALLDEARADLVATMRAAEVFLEEGTWSESLTLAPDPFGPGADAAPAQLRVRHTSEGLDLEIMLPPTGADEAIVCVSLPRNLDEHDTRRWFEFHAPLTGPGPVARIGRHGRVDPATGAGSLAHGDGTWTLSLPWSSLHPYRPPVELLLGLNVTLRRETGSVPADRWALIRDPHAASSLTPSRRFTPLVLDPGPAPARLMAGRLDTYLVIGDSLSVELGIQGLPEGEYRVDQTVNDAPDTSFAVLLAPDLDYLTLDYRLPDDPPTGWFELGAVVTGTDGRQLAWRDRGFRLHPDWFLEQNERSSAVLETERSIVQYELMRTLRGQQRFLPHDDPADLAAAAIRTERLLDRAESTGTVLPAAAGAITAAFPLGDDALQACQLVLPDPPFRAGGTLVVVVTATRPSAAAVAASLAEARTANDPRTFAVMAVRQIPGRTDLAVATVMNALSWAQQLTAASESGLAGTPGTGHLVARASLRPETTPVPVLILESIEGVEALDHATVVTPPGNDAAAWAEAILAWD